jgi:uncharacterized membrane protein (UPF0127 family)
MTVTWRLVKHDGKAVAASLKVADGFWSLLIGWQFCKAPPAGEALLLVPCKSVHTFFVRFPMDVIILDRRGRVVKVRRHVRPWRIVAPVVDGYATLELPGGTAEVEEGDLLRLEGAAGAAVPRSLAFLCARC